MISKPIVKPSLSWLGFLGIGLFSFWIAGFWINPNLSWMHSYISELSVAGQPGAGAFRLMQFIGAICLSIFFILTVRRHSFSPKIKALLYLLILACSLTAINAFTPMQCSPYLSKVCLESLDSYQFGLVQYFHEATSVIIFGSTVAALFFHARAVKKSPDTICLWSVLILQVIFILIISYQSFHGNHWIGFWQRLSFFGFEIWLVYLVYQLPKLKLSR